ncbi:hypothetical protein Hanom_Chr06g00528451 [Helianthus anomalus]
MVWRHPDDVLNEPEPSKSDLNEVLLKAIRECSSRVRPFPEHLLILLGISKLWDKATQDPVLMRNDQGMHFPCFTFLGSLELFAYILLSYNFLQSCLP